MRQAEETLAEAAKMLESGFSHRSVVNRSYYAEVLGKAQKKLNAIVWLSQKALSAAVYIMIVAKRS